AADPATGPAAGTTTEASPAGTSAPETSEPETSPAETSAPETSEPETSPAETSAPAETLPPPVNTSTGDRPDHPYLGAADEPRAYYVKVNLERNVVTVYGKDAEGFHTVPVRAMLCSTGQDSPQGGIFSLQYTARFEWCALLGGVWGRYCTQIRGDILFHSVPYTRFGDPSSLKYAEFDKLGTSASMGCVRLMLADAKWIYDRKDDIAGVEFYRDEDPGPLGIPGIPKISRNELCRGWDPSDTDPASPWGWRAPPGTEDGASAG
ncbi:MAG: L,D-transpeptidase family protein, partial [Oscillospiraceae bacterium]|nr:L,D-transpeptidase family protein [Oscillospiraceae bacterium]